MTNPYQPRPGSRSALLYERMTTFPALEEQSSWFEQNIVDPLRSFGSGANSLVAGAGWLSEQLGARDFGAAIQDFAQHGVDYWQNQLTPETRAAMARDMFEVTDQGVDFNFTKLVNGITASAPSFVVGLGAGGALAKGMQLFANPLGRSALVNTIKAAQTAGPAATAAQIKAAESAAKGLKFVDDMIFGGAYGGSEGVIAGAAVGHEVAHTIRNTGHEDLMERSERYRTLYESYAGEPDERRQQLAKGALADEASTDAGWAAGLATAALGAPAGAFFGRILGPHSTTAFMQAQKFAGLRAGRAVTGAAGALTEGVTEALQSGAEQVATNWGKQDANEGQDLLEGVGESMIEGGLIGSALGGAVGGIAGDPAIEREAFRRSVTEEAVNVERKLQTNFEKIDAAGLSDVAEKLLSLAKERGQARTLSDLTYLAENETLREETEVELYGEQDVADPQAEQDTLPDEDDDTPNFGMPEPARTLPDDDELLVSRGGDESEGRRAMRQSLIAERFAGKAPAEPDRKPRAIVLGGGGASGKGTILNGLRAAGLVPENAVELDPDSFKTGDREHGLRGIPEYGSIVEAGDSRAAATAHEESSRIYTEARQAGIDGRYDLVLDRTMSDTKKGRAELQLLRDAGYEVNFIGVTVDTKEAIKRAVKRATGPKKRYVPIDVLLKAHKGFSNAVPEYVDLVDSMSIYDNNQTEGEPPTLIARKDGGKLSVVDQKRYNEFEKKGTINEQATTGRELWSGGRGGAEQGRLGGSGGGTQGAGEPAAELGEVPDSPRPAGQEANQPGLSFRLREAAASAATSPTNALPEPTGGQKQAGNYLKGHARIKGLDVSFEHDAGSERKLTKRAGTIKMQDHYGYIRGIQGADGDHLDVFVRDTDDETVERSPIFVAEQLTPDGKFDEHKVYMGFGSEKAVRASFAAHQQLKPAMRMAKVVRKFSDPAAFRQWAKEQEQGHKAKAQGFGFETAADGRMRVRGDLAKLRTMMADAGVPTKGAVKRDAQGEYLDITPTAASAVRNVISGVESKASRAGAVIAHQQSAGGKLVGAPAKYDTEAKLPPLRRLLRKLALEGEPGRFWYEQSSQDILDFVGGKVDDADLFAKLLAIYSPQAKVDSNTTFAIKAYYQIKAGLPVQVKTKVQDRKAQAAADGAPVREWMGEKTNNFYLNLMLRIDPARVADMQGATIDVWMMRAFEYDSDAPTATQYKFAEIETNRLARDLGWEPQQVQAAIWVAMKARTENKGVKDATEDQSEAAGDMVWVEKIDEETGKKKKIRDFTSDAGEARHRRRWLDNALAHKVTPEDTSGAGFHFGDGLRAHESQLSWEATPSTNLTSFSWIHESMEAKMMLQSLISEAVGQTIIREMGLMTEGATFGFGGWEGVVSPSDQEFIVAGSQATAVEGLKTKKPFVLDEVKKRMDVMAAIYGLLLKQDGVAWHRAYFGDTVKTSNGVHLEYGRTLDAKETDQLYAEVVKQAVADGVSLAEARKIAPIPHTTGVRFLNFTAYEDNAKFHKMINRAATNVVDASWELFKFRSDGNLIEDREEGGYGDGQGYRQRIVAAGFGDQLGRLERSLGPKIADAYRKVAAKYRKGGAEGLAFRLREGGAGSDGATPRRDGAQAEAGQGGVAPRFAAQKVQKDAVSAIGIHYGPAGLKALDPTMAGTGAAGGERRRFGVGRFGQTNPRLNFYVREPGAGVPPSEQVVGGAESYHVDLQNLYDYEADPRGFVAANRMNADALEEEVSDAGFDGILFPKHPQIPVRTAIVFGFKRKIPAVPVPAGEPVLDLRYALKAPSSAQFKTWFGDSKVVDASGKPMVVYHGTHGDFTQFEQPSRAPDLGFHFGTQEQANQFVGGAKGANVMPVFLKIENPLRMKDVFGRGVISKVRKSSELMRLGVFDSKDDNKIRGMTHGAATKYMQDKIKAAGYDGIVYDNFNEGGGDSYAVFDQAQIKSATGNSGEFDGNSPDIRMSLQAGAPAAPKGMSKQAIEGLKSLLAWHGKERIEVYESESDLPQHLQDKISEKGYAGRVQGFFDPSTGNVVLVAAGIDTPEQAYRTIVEEYLRHNGLRRFFGDDKLHPFLDNIYSSLPQSALQSIARDYNLRLDEVADRRVAVDEYLAKLRIGQEKSPLMTRVGDFFRGALRQMGFKMKYTNSDIIHILQQVEDGVRSGRFASSAWNGKGPDPVAPMDVSGKRSDAMFRLKRATGTAAVETSLAKIQPPRPAEMSLGDRMRTMLRDVKDRWNKDFALDLEQAIFDSGASIKDWEKRITGGMLDGATSPGKMYDLARNPSAVMAAVMRVGVPELKDGAFQPVAGRKGLIDILRPLYETQDGLNLAHLWEGYASARRSAQLIKQQNRDGSLKEKRLDQTDIDNLLALELQYPVFRQVFDDWQAFNNQMLDFAVANGTLSQKTRDLWAQHDYVPFYRVMEDLSEQHAAGGSTSSKLSGRAVKSMKLTGADMAAEPVIESIVKNSAYILDSVYKNEAMKRIVDIMSGHALTRAPMAFKPIGLTPGQVERAFNAAGIALMSERDIAATKPSGQLDKKATSYRSQLKQLTKDELDTMTTMFQMTAPGGANVVSVMVAGKPQYFHVDDPLLLRSIQAIGPQSMSALMKLMSGAKETLTSLVTTDPGFMAVNFMRDTISAWVTSEAPFKPFVDGLRGALKSWKDDPLRWQLQTAGASLGGFYDTRGKDVYSELSLDTGTASKVGVRANWRRWQRFGSHFENANRIAIAEGVLRSGGSVAEAAWQSQDIMNFSMHGDGKSIRALTQSIPFLNARLQGLYRLWRGRNAGSFWMRGIFGVTVPTLLLLGMNSDDERYWELEDFERDAYWHFWVGDEHIKIAKPFEVGQIFGTIVERGAATAFGPDTGRLFLSRMASMVKDTFAMNPVPQLVKPIIEQYSNKNSFTGRPIENLSLSGLLPEERYMPWTSETARLFAEALPDWAPSWLRSPVRVEAMVRGYLGTIGLYGLQAADQLSRPLGGYGEPPAMALKDLPVVRRFYGGETATRTRYEEPLYKLLDEANKTYRTVSELRRRGMGDEAQETAIDSASLLQNRKRLQAYSNQLRALNLQERAVWNSDIDDDIKRQRIDALRETRNAQMRQAAALIEELDAHLPWL